ncbi:EamA family transporter RarD [Rhodobacteraceae bacterium XHP0102]|nr:EamA family transporter RarD [Rhodobacteraceae bacterium XHP0102]
MSGATKGVLAMVGACVIWGFSALYYKLLADIPPLEVLAHRTLWSVVVFVGVLALQARIGELRLALSGGRSFALIGAAALMISTNWFFFIFSIQTGHLMQSSLGYYIFPLVAVALGAIVLKERLSNPKKIAVLLAAVAVVQLTIGLGVAPWISLILAFTFGLYGLIKRYVAAGPVVSVTAEVILLGPIAFGYLVWLGRDLGVFGADLVQSGLLILSGPLTAAPLILFSYASKRAALSTIGLVQYLNPTLQFTIAVVIFGEVLTLWHGVAFALIWTGLALYSANALKPQAAR